jgi:hypothetical protein
MVAVEDKTTSLPGEPGTQKTVSENPFRKTRQTSDRDQKTDQLGERCGTGRSWFSYVFMCSYDVFVCFYMFL